MYWKKLGPHIEEFIVFLTIVIGLNLFFLCTDAIRINWSTTVVLFVILLSIWLIGYVFTFIVFDILVVVDLITKNYITESARFLEQYIFRSTSYLDKCVYEKRNIKNVRIYQYKVVAKTRSGIKIFTSVEYFELKSNDTYEFVYGKKSKALVEVKKLSAGCGNS